MRAVYVAALILFSAAVLGLSYESPGHANQQATLLLAQNVAGAQNAPAAPHSPSNRSQASANSNAKQKPEGNAQSTDPNAQQPSTTPWLGAPPQFQRTWPPTPLPQSGDDDLLLIIAPTHPPKVHKV